MAWTESHTVLIRHRKLVELAAALRIRPAYAIGHLHALWHVALEQQEDGDLSAWSDEFIALASDFPGDAPQYVRLLQKHRWLDGKLIHDWLDYAGRYLDAKYRIGNPKRLAEIKEKHSEQSVVKQQTDSSLTRDGPPDLTVPTVPNQPTEARAREGLEKSSSVKNSTVLPLELASEPRFVAAWTKWLEHLKQKRKPATLHAQDLQLARCVEWGTDRAIKAIEASIERNWQGLYEERNNANDDRNKHIAGSDTGGNKARRVLDARNAEAAAKATS